MSFLLATNTYTQNISIEATYSHAITNKKITKSNEPKILKDIEYKLLLTSNESRFELIKRMESDARKSNSRFVRGAGATGVFYRNLSSDEKLHSFDFLGQNIVLKEDFKKQKWNLTKETKKIDKYICYKAIYNFTDPQYKEISTQVVAWYTPEIPVPFGPVGYDGLPGLILKLNYVDNIFIAKEIKILKESSLTITKPKGKAISRKQFIELVKKRTGYDAKKEFEKSVEKLKKKKSN